MLRFARRTRPNAASYAAHEASLYALAGVNPASRAGRDVVGSIARPVRHPRPPLRPAAYVSGGLRVPLDDGALEPAREDRGRPPAGGPASRRHGSLAARDSLRLAARERLEPGGARAGGD